MAEPIEVLGNGKMLSMYRTMFMIRRFEDRVNELYMQGQIPSTLHLYVGQEAVAVGVCANLDKDDYITSTHRPHGHAIAKGVSIKSIMAELYGKKTGCCQGKGGSMHVGDIQVGMFPAIAIVGANIPITAGAALACKFIHPGKVAVSFFGDGASNEGAFHEGLNMAAIWNLPAVFVCENNLYAASTPFTTTFKIKDVSERAAAYGMLGEIVDGNDVIAVYNAAKKATERARAGQGPTLLECKTYRQCGHSRSDPRGYRTKEEEAEWIKRDPILLLAERLLSEGNETSEDIKRIEDQVNVDIEGAIVFAKESPDTEPSDTLQHVYYG
ncbi:MAG: thiamine pyrophosphate-dependent dehydrogenase E1 component subunit alpha [Chloroflexota bacterium]|jgi:pyruvate dehydrogenase E1 component alpha subunit